MTPQPGTAGEDAPAPAGEPLLRLERVARRYGDTLVFEDVSLQVAAGEFVALLGESGVGKSTLLNVIAGLDDIDAGSVRLAGRDVHALGERERALMRREELGFVFQAFHVLPHLSVAANVALPLLLQGRDDPDRVREMLDAVGLSGLGERAPAQISGGQLQRVAIARALVIRPQVLLFDEPLSNLDARLRVSMRGEIRALQKSLGITAIYVTHDQEEAMSVSDRIALMNAGRLEQVGLPVDIYRHPVSRFAAEFMGTTNLVEARTLGLAAPVWVSLRPEALRFAEQAPAGWPRLTATIAGLEMLGPLTRLDLRLADGTTLRMATLDTPQQVLTEGAVLSLSFDTARLMIVP